MLWQIMFSGKVVVAAGESICIDGGQTRQMIYRGDFSWTLDIK